MYRHNPQTKRAKQLVADGAIGELRLVRSTFSYSLYDETTSGCARTSKAAR
jgi:predicted dehydrogenase